MKYTITGVLLKKETNEGIPGVIIKAYDKDLLFDDLLGSTKTDDKGEFQLHYEEKDFQELFEKKPDIYFEVINHEFETIFSTESHVRFGSGESEFFKIEIPASILGEVETTPFEPNFPTDFTSVDLRSLLIVLTRSHNSGKIDEVLGLMKDYETSNPGTMLLMPRMMINSLIPHFAFFGLCSGTTATATVTLAASALSSATRTLTFSYAYTGKPTCSVSLKSVKVVVFGITMLVNGITDNGATVTGKIPATAGALPAQTNATITATFSASAGWCDTCKLPTPTVSTTITIGP